VTEERDTAQHSELTEARAPYEPPRLIAYGALSTLTAAGSAGKTELGAEINPNRIRQ